MIRVEFVNLQTHVQRPPADDTKRIARRLSEGLDDSYTVVEKAQFGEEKSHRR